MGGLSFTGLDWVWAIHTLLNGSKWAIGFEGPNPFIIQSNPLI